MTSSWSNWYDRIKDRRYGMVFLLTPLLVPALLISLLMAIGRALSGRREKKLNYSRLSSDELAKARSRLLKNRNGQKL